MWEVCIWKAFDEVYHGEAILTKAAPNVPKIMLDGIPFMVSPKGVEGENVKYIFPPLIPRILAVVGKE